MGTKLNWFYKELLFAIFILLSNSVVDVLAGDFTFDNMGKRILLALISGIAFALVMRYVDKKKTE